MNNFVEIVYAEPYLGYEMSFTDILLKEHLATYTTSFNLKTSGKPINVAIYGPTKRLLK